MYRRDADGYLHPVEYKSKAFVDAQKYLLHMIVNVWHYCMLWKSFRHHMLHQEFEVQTDKSALSQAFSSRDLSDLYPRWYYTNSPSFPACGSCIGTGERCGVPIL